MNRIAVLAVGLVGCGGAYEPPWYADWIGVRPSSAVFDDEGVLHVLGIDADNQLVYGTVDPKARKDGFVSQGALTVDGVPQDGTAVSTDLAIRPGGEVWAWVGGSVGPIGEGAAMDSRLQLETHSQYFGALAFEDADTLHTGVYGKPWEIYTIDGSGTPVDPVPFEVTNDMGQTEIVPAPCDLDIVEGMAYANVCEWTAVQMGFDLAARTYQYAETRFVTADHGLEIATNGSHCVNPFDGYAFEGEEGEDTCFEDWAFSGYEATSADLAPDGESFMVLYWGIALLLFDEDKPASFEADKTGTWCSLVNGETMRLADDGTYTPKSSSGTEVLYTELTWSQSAQTITTKFHNPETGLTQGDDQFVHWARRVGDTLHVRTAKSKAETDHHIDSGFTSMTGVWYKCGD